MSEMLTCFGMGCLGSLEEEEGGTCFLLTGSASDRASSVSFLPRGSLPVCLWLPCPPAVECVLLVIFFILGDPFPSWARILLFFGS